MSNLSFQFISNACGIFTGKNGSTVLCDPWLVDGVFEGSWCHIHPLKTKLCDVQNVDAIFVSHLHPDHFDERNFDFDKEKPIIVLDHGPNFLIKKLESIGFNNLIKIKNGETGSFLEFEITLYAPFSKHNFHDSTLGNLIDCAMVIDCDGVKALNANDNTPDVEACKKLKGIHGKIDLAMLNYNAAGPYPSCFSNLSEEKKIEEHFRILNRNYDYLATLIQELSPKAVLPFAGAYVLGGKQSYKNAYLGVASWDDCADALENFDLGETKIVLMQETNSIDIVSTTLARPYSKIEKSNQDIYIKKKLAKIIYEYEEDLMPSVKDLIVDIEHACNAMLERHDRYNIKSDFKVGLVVDNELVQILPSFKREVIFQPEEKYLRCDLDLRLLKRIIDRKAHWNNAEIGGHIDFYRSPNQYEPDLHTGLQFFHR